MSFPLPPFSTLAMFQRPINGIRISPFQNGKESMPRYLIEVGAKSFLVNFRTRVLIEALQHSSNSEGVASYINSRIHETISNDDLTALIAKLPPALFDDSLASQRKSPIYCRVTLIPAQVVKLIAMRAALFFSTPFLTAFGIAVAATAPFAYIAARDSLQAAEMNWGTLPLLIIGLVVSALSHELGHASAVARSGSSPGHIGFGLYWIFPVFYTDVTAAWGLPPRQRVMVDIGGMYFQLLFVVGLTPFAFIGPWAEPVSFLIFFNLYSILHNLNPIFKMDGYWLLSDIARMPNLHKKTLSVLLRSSAHSATGGGTRLLLMLYGLTVCAYFGYLITLIPGAVMLHIVPRISKTAAHMAAFVESYQKDGWPTAAGHLWLALQSSVVPAISAVILVLWLVTLLRRRGAPLSKSKA